MKINQWKSIARVHLKSYPNYVIYRFFTCRINRNYETCLYFMNNYLFLSVACLIASMKSRLQPSLKMTLWNGAKNGLLMLILPKQNCFLLLIWEPFFYIPSAWPVLAFKSGLLSFVTLMFPIDMNWKVYIESIVRSTVLTIGTPCRARHPRIYLTNL